MHTLTFTDQQLSILGMALGEIPHKLAAPLILAINQQLEAQRATGSDGSNNSEEKKQGQTES